MWTKFENWQKNAENGMTKEKYLLICEQVGDEPNPNKMPLDLEDFPSDVQKAFTVFGRLGDRVLPDIGYLGKDYTALPIHMRIANVKNEEVFIEALLRLDSRLMEEMAAKMKAERNRAKTR